MLFRLKDAEIYAPPLASSISRCSQKPTVDKKEILLLFIQKSAQKQRDDNQFILIETSPIHG